MTGRRRASKRRTAASGRHTQPARPPEHVAKMAALAQCPDCDSDVLVRQDRSSPGGWRLTVRHDDNCVQYRWRAERGALTSLSFTNSDGGPLTAEQAAAIADAVAESAQPTIVRLDPDSVHLGRSERDAASALVDPEEPA